MRMKERDSQSPEIEIQGLIIHDQRSIDKGPALFNPIDFLFYQIGDKITLIAVGSAGSRDYGDYPNNLEKAINDAKKEISINESRNNVDIYFLSAFNAYSKFHLEPDGTQTIFPVEKFMDPNSNISPREAILAKCCQ